MLTTVKQKLLGNYHEEQFCSFLLETENAFLSSFSGVRPETRLLPQPKVFCVSLNPVYIILHTFVFSTIIYKINEISLPGSYQPSQPAISCSNYNNLHVVEIALPVCIVILKCGHKIHLSSLRSRAPGLTAR